MRPTLGPRGREVMMDHEEEKEWWREGERNILICIYIIYFYVFIRILYLVHLYFLYLCIFNCFFLYVSIYISQEIIKYTSI